MNLLKTGLIKLHQDLSKLKEGWDGYSGKPIDPDVLDSSRNMSFVHSIITLFRNVGIEEKDIEVVPTPKGTIQYESEKNNIYLEVEVTKEYYLEYKKREE